MDADDLLVEQADALGAFLDTEGEMGVITKLIHDYIPEGVLSNIQIASLHGSIAGIWVRGYLTAKKAGE